MQKIRSIEVVATDVLYVVGRQLSDSRKVGAIKDQSTEYENGIEFIYRIEDVEGNLIAEVINCPVVLEYFKPEVEE